MQCQARVTVDYLLTVSTAVTADAGELAIDRVLGKQRIRIRMFFFVFFLFLMMLRTLSCTFFLSFPPTHSSHKVKVISLL